MEEKGIDNVRWSRGYDGKVVPAIPAHIAEIAKLVQETVSPDNFDTVFNAIIQVKYYSTNDKPYTVALNTAMSAQVTELLARTFRNPLNQDSNG